MCQKSFGKITWRLKNINKIGGRLDEQDERIYIIRERKLYVKSLKREADFYLGTIKTIISVLILILFPLKNGSIIQILIKYISAWI